MFIRNLTRRLQLSKQQQQQIWSSKELVGPPKNNFLFSFEKMMNQFNHTSTFKRQSDLTLITQYLTSIEDLESDKYLKSTKEKNRLQKEEGLAPLAYV